MKTTRFASIGFVVFWLAVLTMLSFWPNYEGRLAVYVLLATLIGIRHSCLIRTGSDRSVAGALAFGAAIHFGPIGGAVVGLAVAISHYAGKRTELKALPAGAVSGVAAGLSAGLVYTSMSGSIIGIASLEQAFLILKAGAASFTAILLINLIERRSRIYRSSLERLKSGLPSIAEFGVGAAVVAVFVMLEAVYASGILPLVFPVIYLTRQAVTDFGHGEEQDNTEMWQDILHSLVTAIDARDRFTGCHTPNVMKLSVSIARRMDMSTAEMEGLKIAAMLHDIGKLWVPEHIVLKPGRLSPDQLDQMRDHPELGERIMDDIAFPWPVGSMIRSHHERWDGGGYPDGRKGDEIPLGARILGLSDVFDAMTSKRSYRASKTLDQTLAYIRGASGTHFDPAVVQAFDQVIADGELPEIEGEDDATKDIQAIALASKMVNKVNQLGMAERSTNTNSEFIAMFEIAQTASTSLNLWKVLHLLANKVKDMISCSACLIVLRDDKSDRLEVKLALGANAEYFEEGFTTVGRVQSPTSTTASTGKGMIARYDKNDLTLPLLAKSRFRIDDWVELRSGMSVPLICGETVIGTINLYHSKANAFSDGDLRLLSAVAPQVAKAIKNAQLFKQTTESALTDALTGIPNARYLFIRMEHEMERAKRLNKPLSVLGLDLDNFKEINDSFGHEQGDTVLKDMSKIFLSHVRDYDLVCRYAGDEFVIVLPYTSKEEAVETARRIQAAVGARPSYGYGDNRIHVGVSIGVASFPDDSDDIRGLISKADLSMYEEKRSKKQNHAA